MALDDLDRDILRALQENARLSHRELARKLGSTGPTVAARIARMEHLGVIQGYTVRIDASLFGAPLAAVPAVDLDRDIELACHTCGQRTATPHWLKLNGRDHPFCCPMCREAFATRHAKLSEGL